MPVLVDYDRVLIVMNAADCSIAGRRMCDVKDAANYILPLVMRFSKLQTPEVFKDHAIKRLQKEQGKKEIPIEHLRQLLLPPKPPMARRKQPELAKDTDKPVPGNQRRPGRPRKVVDKPKDKSELKKQEY